MYLEMPKLLSFTRLLHSWCIQEEEEEEDDEEEEEEAGYAPAAKKPRSDFFLDEAGAQ